MKKVVWIPVLGIVLLTPLVILVWRVFTFKPSDLDRLVDYSDRGPPPANARPATETNPMYVRLQAHWQESVFEPFHGSSDIPARLGGLNRLGPDPIRSEEFAGELSGAVKRVVQSLLAGSYEEYLSGRSAAADPQYDSGAILGQAGNLRVFFGVEESPERPGDVHRLYWSTMTEEGTRAGYWKEVSWRSSWIQFQSQASVEDWYPLSAMSSILMKVPNCGIVCYLSSFRYSPSPEEVYAEDGEVQTALVHLLVRTSDGPAYPLLFHFYRAPSIRTWFPTHLAVGYVGVRKFDPVF